MKGAVDVLDYVDHLEIWNHARLMNNLKSDPITAQDEKTLSQVLSAPRLSRVIDWKTRMDMSMKGTAIWRAPPSAWNSRNH